MYITDALSDIRTARRSIYAKKRWAKQIRGIFQKVSLCDAWTANILKELEKDKLQDVHSSHPHQQNLEHEISILAAKVNKLIDLYLESAISKDDYTKKKAELLNKKRELQESIRDFADGGNNWFEHVRDFVKLLNRGTYPLTLPSPLWGED